MVCINGHTLTGVQRETLHAIQDYMRLNAGDSHWGPNTSPKGDGRWVPCTEIFSARTNRDSARRRTASRLADMGVLKACEIVMWRGLFKGFHYGEGKHDHDGCCHDKCPMWQG